VVAAAESVLICYLIHRDKRAESVQFVRKIDSMAQIQCPKSRPRSLTDSMQGISSRKSSRMTFKAEASTGNDFYCEKRDELGSFQSAGYTRKFLGTARHVHMQLVTWRMIAASRTCEPASIRKSQFSGKMPTGVLSNLGQSTTISDGEGRRGPALSLATPVPSIIRLITRVCTVARH
jgi:hypothetical protein